MWLKKELHFQTANHCSDYSSRSCRSNCLAEIDVVQGSFLGQLVEGVCTLLQSKAREILSPTLGLVKVLVTILEDVTLAQYVEQLILHIARMGNTNRRNLRVPIRSIYTRFIRKFGYEMIYKLVLEDHKKIVQNIKKKQERTKRHRAMKERQSGGGDDNEEEEGDEAPALMPSKPKPETIDELLQDSESETDEEEEKAKGKGQKVKGRKSKKQQASKQGAAWLKEGQQEDTPLDFLDPSVSKRVLATKPDEKSNKPSTGVRHNFKTMPDGRLIIAEPEEKEEGREGAKIGKKRAGQKQDLEVMDDLEELMEEELATRKAGRKRKVEDLSVSDDENETPRKYQAGGIGIHRPVAVAKRTLKEPGREYKAKKAKGDVKKKDKHDPYAYVPLNRQQLNRRMKAKSAGPWKKLAPKGKRGAKQSGRGHKK